MKRFKFGLLPRILVAIVLGIVVGNWLPLPLTRVFITFNSIFGQFLGFMIPLIIVGLVTPAIGDIGRGAGRLLVVTVLIAYLDTVFAGLLSFGTGSWLFPDMIGSVTSAQVEKATAIDLAGRDVFEAVQTSVNPKVIDTPPVAAVAKNGIQLIAKARVTVRANIHQLVGGAGEDTILARVGEGIVSSIGSAESHESVLENPDSISKLVLRKGLDVGTAYEILSIDIADIDVGKNIGATLQMDQANADKNIAQAKAEERRAMAVATEQEMKARAQEARAEVIQAEAEVPKALAQALREGKMGFMDYYKLENLKGDTAMREGISKMTAKDVKGLLHE